MEDTIDLAALYESVKDSIPQNATHFAITWESRRNAGMWRLSDGMFVGEAGDKTCIFGVNPNKRESRLFLTHNHAKRYLFGSVAEEDRSENNASGSTVVHVLDFERHLAETTSLVLPYGDTSLVVNGSLPVTGKMPTGRKLN